MTAKYDSEDPLARMEDESPHQNAALHRYAVMGSMRSLKKLAQVFEEEQKKRDRGDKTIPKVPTTSYGTLCKWSTNNDWVNRVMQWEMRQRLEEEEMWKERRKQVREDDWTHARELRQLAEKIIAAAPAFINRSRRVVDEGTPTIIDLEGEIVKQGKPREIVVTVALSIADLVRVEKIAMQMGRLAAEMDESRTRVSVDWQREAANAGLDPTEAFESLVGSYVTAIRRGDNADDGGGAEGSATQDSDK